MTEISGGQKRMKLLYQEFKEKEEERQLAPPLSPKSIQRTPISSRKKSKKQKLVLHCDALSNSQNPSASVMKTERERVTF